MKKCLTFLVSSRGIIYSSLSITVPVYSSLLAKFLKTVPFTFGLDDAFCGCPTYQRNTNLNYNEIPLHIRIKKKNTPKTGSAEDWQGCGPMLTLIWAAGKSLMANSHHFYPGAYLRRWREVTIHAKYVLSWFLGFLEPFPMRWTRSESLLRDIGALLGSLCFKAGLA